MLASAQALWDRFQKYHCDLPNLGLTLDISRMNFGDDYFATMQPRMEQAFAAMSALEAGAIANPDEKRMVGHYWLRNPALAPTPELRLEIENTVQEVKDFAAAIHDRKAARVRFKPTDLLVIGIGGSALGPEFVADALGQPGRDRMQVHFLDNTDPDGMDRIFGAIGKRLRSTLCVVISKSGGTKETRNGMLETSAAFERAGLKFPKHAIAVTGRGSELHKTAEREGWIRSFPMWDWVGGRTSETSAVGLLPAALQGIGIQAILDGAKACDEATRIPDVARNPAAQLALMWYYAGQGRGLKDMVIIPYKDRLELFSRYLQQLIMESLGKELDLRNQVVNQGIAVYGNKGSTDQHAYVQQLRDGINNFFVTFVRVLKDREGESTRVEPEITSGDYLQGFLLGTRQALFEKARESMTITIGEVSPFSVGVLIALYERAVGFYASLINVNAYHQPGVEAGKKAAGNILSLQQKVIAFLRANPSLAYTPAQLAEGIQTVGDVENIYHVCEHLAANPGRGIMTRQGPAPGSTVFQAA